ncbi:unnamed protein product [Dovyalis caffra]|uniref:dUTP diphosphatase n=1 Tax=Dovyalis caffra TaxID=77055 RepID=A0AAV1SQL5_9ROSI|nr:unnamed protein product [Dovyalis caffra]
MICSHPYPSSPPTGQSDPSFTEQGGGARLAFEASKGDCTKTKIRSDHTPLYENPLGSGVALKHGIDVGAGVIEADYRGPVGVVLFNHSDTDLEESYLSRTLIGGQNNATSKGVNCQCRVRKYRPVRVPTDVSKHIVPKISTTAHKSEDD